MTKTLVLTFWCWVIAVALFAGLNLGLRTVERLTPPEQITGVRG